MNGDHVIGQRRFNRLSKGEPRDKTEKGEVMAFFDLSDINPRNLSQGVEMRVLSGEKMMMVFFKLAPGAEIPEHAHPHEQMGTVLEGEVELVIDGEKRVVRKGNAYHIPPGVPHSGGGRAVSAQVLDVFVPPREDYE